MRAARVGATGCVVLALGAVLAGCKGSDLSSGSGSPGGGSSASDVHGTSPLADPDGTKPGLAAISSEKDKASARDLISKLATKGRGPKTGYERDKFGYAWMDTVDGVPLARNGCDTRNDLLKLHGQDVEFRKGSDCVVVSMDLHDPYTGKDIAWKKAKATEVQIDHVVPLSYAWQMGASRWSREKRQQLANDVLNLLPVSGSTNSAKGDSGPASWLPPSKAIRCSYSVRFAQVALKYQLPVTGADKNMMLQQCRA
ncbi:HNH endonuclease [Streptomyces chromofuscus]|uniref:HNH endonuclease n=1 Tax=Streptomyces chromofuscus TaxID=42881 RepID=A0A7M2TFT5_STRCW|nr:HNH endonuclease [Streptomyces chromofuscus]